MTSHDSNVFLSKATKKYREGKLDEAFLFIISIIGLLFTIVQVYLNQLNGIIQLIPLLILGVAFPFYIGFIRGAIQDSIVERLRGWIYLIVGVSAYCALIMFELNNVYSWLFFVFAFVAIASIHQIEKWFKDIFSFEETSQNMFAYSGAVASSLLFACAFCFFILYLKNPLPIFIITLIIPYGFFTAGIVSEKLSIEVQNSKNPRISNALKEIQKELEEGQAQIYPQRIKFLLLIASLELKLLGYGFEEVLKSGSKKIFGHDFKAKYFILLSIGTFLSGSFLVSSQHLQEAVPIIIPDILIIFGLIFSFVSIVILLQMDKFSFEP
jgi:hypothetical protein